MSCVPPCDPSLVKGVPASEFEFNNGLLKCKYSKQILAGLNSRQLNESCKTQPVRYTAHWLKDSE
ncbi:hypothetical protein PRIPAC_75944 [Pristionchus pacificus]|uniref:Uncharacterized protein n=1 Tax=Pristionchus pacificus TaxID=54126 RepID=A0A2A6CFV7_PRIPA|nr:hypothetical protein PRIPAC_75944 [Pristionchus pacificus]|eukprot:PDM77092.1 hypothetical protein PRIPAC_42487 [Pristionchus pacificus]